MTADADNRRKDEHRLALDEPGLEAAHHDLKDGAITPACGPWRDDLVARLQSRMDTP